MSDASDHPELAGLADEKLFEHYRRGNEKALEEIINRYRQELFNLLLRFMGDRAAAEDVFQDVFLQIHQSADTFDPTRQFKPWLFTIAANKARDHMRRRARRPVAPLDAPMGGQSSAGQTFMDLLEAELPMPHERMEKSELAQRVQQTIADMPDHLREILLLSYFQQLSYNEIADILQIPLGTVKSRLHTAVASFAKAWKKQNSHAE